MMLTPLKARQAYVVVSRLSDWNEYPTKATLVRDSTILAIVRPENDTGNVLVYYNFTQGVSLVPMSHIHVFDWEARTQTNNGLFQAYQ